MKGIKINEFEIFKESIIDEIKLSFEIKEVELDFKKEFYYPRFIHIMKFNIEQYEILGLGNMAILKGKGFGLMNILTVVFTPSIKKDIPLVIIDFINMANKRTVFVEFYINHIIKNDRICNLENKLKELSVKYSDIENYIEKPNWYTSLRNVYSPLKKSTKEQDKVLYEMVIEYLQAYLSCVSNSETCIESKNIQLEAFINDLIYKGNPSTAVLKKALGEEDTIKLFKEIIFNYK
ncbi:MAG: hypothetical protein ACRC92_16275 [Peptostreptococcaceae bacterium]